jgi:soluble lytic murein transglycosylase
MMTVLFVLAIGAHAEGSTEPVLPVMSVGSQLNDKDIETLKQGFEAHHNENWDLSFKHLKPYLERDNPIPDYILSMLGQSERERGDCAMAVTLFQELRKSYQQSLHVDASYFHEAKAQLCSKNFEQARTLFNTFLKKSPKPHEESESRFLIAKSYYLADELETAKTELSRFWVDTINIEFADKAYDLLKEMEALPGEDTMWERARHLYKKREWGQAKNLLTQLGAQDSYLFAECVFRMKDYLRAKKLFQKLARSGKGYRQSIGRLATIEARTENYQKAIDYNVRLAKKYSGTKYEISALKKIVFLYKDSHEFNKAGVIIQELLSKKLRSKDRADLLEDLVWVKYRGKEYEEALAALAKLDTNKKTATKYLFWEGKILEKMKKKKAARKAYQRAWQRSPWSYYGLAAQKILNPDYDDFSQAIKKADEVRAARIRQVNFDEPERDALFHLPRAEALHQLGFKRLASQELEEAYREAKGSTTLLRHVGKLAYASNLFNAPMLIALKHPGILDRPQDAWYWIYPSAYNEIVTRHAEHRQLDPRLVFSMMRQESNFKEHAVSPVGARGLIQIMPYTGQRLAKIMGWEGFEVKDLFDPEINIALSTLYLRLNSDLFANRLPMVIASYNAGEAAVERWLPSRKNLDDWEFIEEIPYNETRTYVKRVLRNYWMYQYLYPSPDDRSTQEST